MAEADIDKAIERLEDYTLTRNLARCQNYQTIQSKLEFGCDITDPLVKRLLTVCSHDLKGDMKYAANGLTIISLVLKKVKDEECTSQSEVVQSALAILQMIKTTARVSKVQSLQKLCFSTFLLYPDQTYVELVTKHCGEITDAIDLYLHSNMSNAVRLMMFTMIHKLLTTIPPPIRLTFVKDNVKVWFARVIPTAMTLIRVSYPADREIVEPLDVLEILTNDLQNIDYAKNEQWQQILACTFSPQEYPALMKALLEDGSDLWCRIWIIFVRLLKQQVTMSTGKLGSPISFMLPIVESAFKMDSVNRCRAFQCWSVLIDNFATESNETLIKKRVRLLVVPLKVPNAKVEDVALAKFHTWWHLIRKFHSRMGFLADMIFFPFLQYCFGSPGASVENNLVPGLISRKIKILCLQAFAESVGHVDCGTCQPCTLVASLSNKILTPKLLLNHLSDWLHALKVAIKIILEENDFEQGSKMIRCMWKSLLISTTKLPEDDRELLTKKLIKDFLMQLVKDNPRHNILNVVLNVLLQTFFDEELLRYLLVPKAIKKEVVTLTLEPALYTFYPSHSPEQSLTKLKPITSAVVDNSPNDMVDWFLGVLPLSDQGLMLWTSLVESIKETKCHIDGDNLKNIVLWPLKNSEHFHYVQYPASVWNALYTAMRPVLSKTSTDKDMFLILLTKDKDTSTNQFCLYAILQIIKHILENPRNTDCKIEAELLINILSKLIKQDKWEVSIIPVIVDSLVVMLTKASEGNNSYLPELSLEVAKYTLKLIVGSKETGDNDNQKFLVQLLKPINDLFNNDACIKFKCVILDQLIACSTAFKKYQDVKDIVLSILKIFLSKSVETEVPLYNMVKDAITSIENDEGGTKTREIEFSAPKAAAKKFKKNKELSILNTSAVNDEHYLRIDNKWKFDPKKLTENQREKLLRRREDIPALYQDLSHSPEEVNLVLWRTDSQDTSMSSSNSKSTTKGKDDPATVLKTMPCTDVVPKIMQNIFSDSAKETIETTTVNENVNTDTRSPKNTSKQPKSPRLALKDRLSHNLKALVEKTALDAQSTSMTSDAGTKTPPPETTFTNVVFSAPPKLPPNRPSRMKRKPRKYDSDFLSIYPDSNESEDPAIHNVKSKKTAAPKSNDGKSNASASKKPTRGGSIHKRRHSAVSDSQKHEDYFDCEVPRCSSANIFSKSKFVQVNDLQITEEKTSETDNKVSEDNDSKKPSIPANKTQKRCSSANILNKIIQDEVSDLNLCDKEASYVKKDEINKKVDNFDESLESEKSLDHDTTQLEKDTASQDEISKPVKADKPQETDKSKSASKKPRRSRIENQLAIDMVAGQISLQKRTRRATMGTASRTRLKALPGQSKSQRKPIKASQKAEGSRNVVKQLFTVNDSQDNFSISTDASDLPQSEDFIESSQDTTISVSTKISAKKKSKANQKSLVKSGKKPTESRGLEANSSNKSTDMLLTNDETKADIEFSQNKTVCEENYQQNFTADMDTEPLNDLTSKIDTEPLDDLTDNIDTEPLNDLTANMDTEPLNDHTANMDTEPIVEAEEAIADDVIIIHDDCSDPINTNNLPISDTQNTANADTEPLDSNRFVENTPDLDDSSQNVTEAEIHQYRTEPTPTMSATDTESGVSSPFKDDEQRNQDFLNNTLEISPIKTMSPLPDNKRTETSTDYEVIQLSSPVSSNGEPFGNSASPEIFTEDPDKRDQSPPRGEFIVNNSSPSSSLSLKKNRPQMRPGNRAAQMVVLCVPNRLKSFMNTEKATDSEESKKSSPLTSVRRNLRILNNCGDNSDENESNDEDNESFLKLKRTLPSANSSPSVPILKRKFTDMDDCATSPASKRKRVSFHDPPVSTTIAVQKYIEPMGSPQASMSKKFERQTRSPNMKSPKKLENVFKVDNLLAKAVESFIGAPPNSEDTEMCSLEQTPSVEVVKTSELNDTDPICPVLESCLDPISNIASELSSPAMKNLLIQELEGKIETIGDLAKLTELEVNRLCIKAPKIKVAKKVLFDYAEILKQNNTETFDLNPIITAEESEQIPLEETETVRVDVETETVRIEVQDTIMQTETKEFTAAQTQTNETATKSCMSQTEESGSKTTEDMVKSCLEREDFIDHLTKQLDVSKTKIISDLPFDTITDVMAKKLQDHPSYPHRVMNCLLESFNVVRGTTPRQHKNKVSTNPGRLALLNEHILKNCSTSDIIFLCKELLNNVHKDMENST